ncbi:hypothetical protein J437_LFUL002738 [Ladona fulva]|uniref:Large ribosomal subunit protein mL42 n=1 Tax=Ladona fulva TaxID=123851 RepID=A0A8K0K135_LADFU|nr:hypothetical protein J437_LFUL002738 [Ladona fulva]
MFFPTSRVIIHHFKPVAVFHRTIKSSVFSNVAETDDGTCFVCWHPERKFPYKYTRPLPQPTEKSAELTNSPLKSKEASDVYQVFKEKTPEAVREELMKITHTTKHRWFPRSRDKYAKKTPRDREYL